jgi:hypothetical protein
MKTIKRLTAAKRNEILERLEELLHEEHCGACNDDLSCDISYAYEQGYTLWAMYLFDGCGAASEEFQRLYATLTGTKTRFKEFFKQARKEADHMCEQDHVECTDCNAVNWGVHSGEEFHCGSCARLHKPDENL